MLDSLPDELINMILRDCMPIDRYEFKRVNKALHAAYIRLNPGNLYVNTITLIKSIFPHIYPEEVEQLLPRGMVVINYAASKFINSRVIHKYIDIILDTLINHESQLEHRRNHIQLIDFFDNNSCEEPGDIRFTIDVIMNSYIKELAIMPIINSRNITRGLEIYSYEYGYASCLWDSTDCYTFNLKHTDYATMITEHLPANIRNDSLLVMIHNKPIEVYIFKKYSYSELDSFDDIKDAILHNIQYLNPDLISDIYLDNTVTRIRNKCNNDMFDTQIRDRIERLINKQRNKHSRTVYNEIIRLEHHNIDNGLLDIYSNNYRRFESYSDEFYYIQ